MVGRAWQRPGKEEGRAGMKDGGAEGRGEEEGANFLIFATTLDYEHRTAHIQGSPLLSPFWKSPSQTHLWECPISLQGVCDSC